MNDSREANNVTIEVHRDHRGRWWLSDEDAEKLAPYLEPDSNVKLDFVIYKEGSK